MNCQTCHSLLTDYLYEELDSETRREFEAALEGCAECQAELAELRRTREAFDALEAIEVPAKLHNDILRAARVHAAEAAAPRRSPFAAFLASPAFGVAFSVLLLGGGGYFFHYLTYQTGPEALESQATAAAVATNVETEFEEEVAAEEAPREGTEQPSVDPATVARNEAAAEPTTGNDRLAAELSQRPQGPPPAGAPGVAERPNNGLADQLGGGAAGEDAADRQRGLDNNVAGRGSAPSRENQQDGRNSRSGSSAFDNVGSVGNAAQWAPPADSGAEDAEPVVADVTTTRSDSSTGAGTSAPAPVVASPEPEPEPMVEEELAAEPNEPRRARSAGGDRDEVAYAPQEQADAAYGDGLARDRGSADDYGGQPGSGPAGGGFGITHDDDAHAPGTSQTLAEGRAMGGNRGNRWADAPAEQAEADDRREREQSEPTAVAAAADPAPPTPGAARPAGTPSSGQPAQPAAPVAAAAPSADAEAGDGGEYEELTEDEVLNEYDAGLEHYDHGNYRRAALAFSDHAATTDASDPTRGDALYLGAVSNIRLDRPDIAQGLLERFLAEYPSHRYAADARVLLDDLTREPPLRPSRQRAFENMDSFEGAAEESVE